MTETKYKDVAIYEYEGIGKNVLFVHVFLLTADK